MSAGHRRIGIFLPQKGPRYAKPIDSDGAYVHFFMVSESSATLESMVPIFIHHEHSIAALIADSVDDAG